MGGLAGTNAGGALQWGWALQEWYRNLGWSLHGAQDEIRRGEIGWTVYCLRDLAEPIVRKAAFTVSVEHWPDQKTNMCGPGAKSCEFSHSLLEPVACSFFGRILYPLSIVKDKSSDRKNLPTL